MSKKTISRRLIENESDYKDPLELQNLFGSVKFLFRSFIGSIISRKVKNKHKNKYLNLGSGSIYQDGWTNADYYRFRDIKIDWMLDAGKTWKCDDNFWDAIFSEHTLEHLTYKCAINALEESYRTLKKGGILRLSLPNINLSIEHLTGKYVSEEFKKFKTNSECISFVTQNWGHKSTWDPELLISLLKEIGFVDVKQMQYQVSQLPEICIETKDKIWESMYIEALK